MVLFCFGAFSNNKLQFTANSFYSNKYNSIIGCVNSNKILVVHFRAVTVSLILQYPKNKALLCSKRFSHYRKEVYFVSNFKLRISLFKDILYI